MVPLSPDDPSANAPPDKASVTLPPQQIVKQYLVLDGHNPENYEFDSDVDSRLSGCHIDGNTLALLENWPRSLPQYGGMPTFSPVGSADSEVYSTPSLFSESSDSDHSTIGPLSPPCDLDPWSAEADEHKDEELFGPDERTYIAPGSLSENFEGSEIAFGTQATFAHAPSFPLPSSCVQWPGYGPPLWQHMDCAAPADVRRPPPSHGYPVLGCLPSAGAAHFMNNTQPEEDVSHMNPGPPWSYGSSMGNPRGGALFSGGADTINPSLLSSVPVPPRYCYHQGSFNSQEQPPEHHYGVAPAGALGLGSDMQMSGYLDGVESAPSLSGPYPIPDASGPRKHVNEAHKDVPSKKPATSTGKKKREQSTKKIHDCPWPGCLQAFARTNNLKVHENGVHYKRRDHVCPVAGCPKANEGFSRKFDLHNHMQKHHPVVCGDAPAA